MIKTDLRIVTGAVSSQNVIVKDNVSVQVSAVFYFRVIEHEKAIVETEDFLFSTSQSVKTTLRSSVGPFR